MLHALSVCLFLIINNPLIFSRQHELEFSTNIDITSYEDGERQTHNPLGRAYASNVWEFFKVCITTSELPLVGEIAGHTTHTHTFYLKSL